MTLRKRKTDFEYIAIVTRCTARFWFWHVVVSRVDHLRDRAEKLICEYACDDYGELIEVICSACERYGCPDLTAFRNECIRDPRVTKTHGRVVLRVL